MNGVTIRPMTDAETEDAVAIHMAAFPAFFLTFLGPRFLRQLYRGIVGDPAGMAWVAEQDGRRLGFVAGTDSPSRFYRRLIRRRLIRFALAAAIPFLRRPSILPRLLRAFTKPAEASASGARRAELMSLAVWPWAQQRGAGALLVQCFIDEARRRGAEVVYLTTDAAGNDAVNRFYERLGFSVVRRFTTAEGRVMNEYERKV